MNKIKNRLPQFILINNYKIESIHAGTFFILNRLDNIFILVNFASITRNISIIVYIITVTSADRRE